MKLLFTAFLTIACNFLLLNNTVTQINDCKCNNIELKGRVKVVPFGADLRVRVVESQPDLRVRKVERSAIECGEWQFVDSGEDFTIQIVNEFADIRIKYVDVSPGMN
ncbi:MAG: hypothetical protein LBE91_10980 [Tannerella sp.]|jgi:hypothetical protein|nr:hypothetical protein [Tannerella sp.]